MKRRTFVKKSALTAFSVAAFGSISWDGKAFTGNTVTTTDILGPFYRPGAPMRSNLIPSGVTGDILNLSGTIFGIDQKPQADALVEAWQCDAHEHYDNTSDDFLFRGAVKTDASGKYGFRTIVPVPYEAASGVWRPAHIHLRISAPNAQDLITQIYFKGGAYIEKDAGSSAPDAVNRILEIKKTSNNENAIVFDVVLDKTYALNEAGFKQICGLYQLKNGRAEFYRDGDFLFLKSNGQVVEALAYKGNNTFVGGISHFKARFELVPDGEPKVIISRTSFADRSETTTDEGVRFLKYGAN